MHQAETRRLHRRGLGGDAHRARRRRRGARATPSGASYSARPTARCRTRSPRALEAGLLPILCVGETEDEREARRDRAQAAPPGAGGARARAGRAAGRRGDRLRADLGDRHRQGATPEIAQDAIAFIRALVGDRSEEAAERIRVLYGGSVKPDNAAEILAQPDVDGALVGGASLDPEGFARIVGGRGAVTLRRASASSSWTAGGSPSPGPGNAVALADTPVFDELWERYPHTHAHGVRARRRPARGPDGQLRGRPPQPGRRARWSSRT